MSIPRSTVVLGGARAGKSAHALRLAAAQSCPVTYVATCPRIEGDHDLDERIRRHRAERPTAWSTVEEEVELDAAIAASRGRFVVVDCLTTWVGNLMHHGRDLDATLVASEDAIAAARGAELAGLVVVSNEVGLGIVPADATTRRYRDALGMVNQRWATEAERCVLLVAGRALRLDAVVDDP